MFLLSHMAIPPVKLSIALLALVRRQGGVESCLKLSSGRQYEDQRVLVADGGQPAPELQLVVWCMQAGGGAQAGLAWATYQQHVIAHLQDLQATVSPALMEADFQQGTGSHPLWQPLPSAASEPSQADATLAQLPTNPSQPQSTLDTAPAAHDQLAVAALAASEPERAVGGSHAPQGRLVEGTGNASGSEDQAEAGAKVSGSSREGSEDGEADTDMDIDTDAAAPASSSLPALPSTGMVTDV